MLDERGVRYAYRDYRDDPLTVEELQAILGRLGVPASDVLRRNDAAFEELALSGEEPDGILLPLIAAHPTLLQRPIAILGDRAIVARPAERLLELL